MGFVADMGVSNTLNDTYVWYKANAYLDAALIHVGRNNLRIRWQLPWANSHRSISA